MRLVTGYVAAALALAAGAAGGAGAFAGKAKDCVLVAGRDGLRLMRTDGTVAWKHDGCGDVHHLELHGSEVWYANGGLYRLDIVSHKAVCACPPTGQGGLFFFERQKNGNFVVAENDTDAVRELTGEGREVVRFCAGRAEEADTAFVRLDRKARKTAAGTYLVCGGGSCLVKEFDRTGRLVWSVKAPAPAADCLRRANGNTLVAHLDAVTEFAPDGAVVWRFACADLPELKLGSVSGLLERPNGGLVIGTGVRGEKERGETALFEMTREKKVVWTYRSADDLAASWTRRWPTGVTVVTPEEAAKQDALVKAAVPAKPAKARRVLVLSHAFGYSHNEALTFGDRALVRGGELTGAWRADVTYDPSRLADASFLSAYDAVVINNSTTIRAKDYPGMIEAFTGFVKAGRGLCLIHSAVDSFYADAPIADMNGGLFRGHPWMAGGTWSFRNEEPDHPVNAALKGEGNPFARSDEIYQQTGPAYSREKDRVLVSMNLSDGPTAAAAKNWKGWLREDGDFAVSWVRRYGSGRVFYTSFGHDKRAFLDAARLGHLFAGLQYCLGDLPCDDRPRKAGAGGGQAR